MTDMEQEKWYGPLWPYIRSHGRGAVVLALFTAVFAGVFALYDLPVEAVLYAAGLCALIGAVMLGAGYRRFWREHTCRQEALNNLLVLTDALPEAGTPAEADFRAMAEKMKRAYAELLTRTDSARWESLDYYSAWVHQIKTPIAVMQMTLQGDVTAEHQALLAELFRIQQYVDMVLSYQRLESESSDLVIRAYDLDAIVREIVGKYLPVCMQKGLRLSYDRSEAGEGPVQVLTDEKWLMFIIGQILDNAVKYTAEGAITLSVTKDKMLRVADTGLGIAPGDLPRIFEKGFTGYNGRTDKTATGLGLYLCRTAAGKLNHRLWCESTPGQGSVFFIDLHTDKLEVE